MTATIEERVVVTTDESDATTHIRCCKPAVPRGLCGKGGPLMRVPVLGPTKCIECAEIWEGDDHCLTCPRDSGFWPTGE